LFSIVETNVEQVRLGVILDLHLPLLWFFIDSQLEISKLTDTLEVSSIPGKNHGADFSRG
jgi:hypothetical protein